MNKVLRIFLLLLVIACCKRSEHFSTTWEIESVTLENRYFNKNMIVELNGSYILVKSKETGETFPAIVKDNRMVIETGHIKWLFEIEKTSDSAMILHEMYSKNPLEIKLVKIKNNHKS